MSFGKQLLLCTTALAALVCQASSAPAQIWSRPVINTAPPPPPISRSYSSNYGPTVVNPLPVTAYRFNGPTAEVYTYRLIPVVTQSCDPARPAPAPTYIFAPVMGYSPGYYLGYDSVRFYRN
jgi:hypothetical protein